MRYENRSFEGGLIFKNLFVTKRTPSTLENNIKGRYSSAFMYIIEGSYHFVGNDGDVFATAGDTIYLPKDGFYRYKILTPSSLCIQVNFDLEEENGSERRSIIFSDAPTVISNKKGETYKLFNEISDLYHTDRLTCTSLVYQLIALCKNELFAADTRMSEKKLAPALQYMEENYTGKICVDDLAARCGISTSHFRRLFKEQMGTTPIKYKNLLLAKAACNLLVNDGLNVSETAYALNFDDIYTFSQAFKKEMGVSPKKYIHDRKKK